MIEILLVIYYAIGIVIIFKVLRQNNIDRRNFREQDREDIREGGASVLEGREEDRLHPLVELADDRQQVLPRLREVSELLRQERVPLFESGELLQRERIDAAQLTEHSLGVLKSLSLVCTVEREGLSLVVLAGNRLIWAIFRNENIFVEREL